MNDMESLQKKIWNKLDHKRAHGCRITIEVFANTLKEIKPNLSYDEYKGLTEIFMKTRGNLNHQGWIPIPSEFECFTKNFIAAIKPLRSLIPFATGFECDYFDVQDNVDYHFFDKTFEYATKLFADIQTIEEIPKNKEYDLIVSALPLGPIKNSFLSCQIVEQCSQLLSNNGYCIFPFAKTITLDSSAKWLSKIEENGLYCVAMIDMPMGAYAPFSLVDSEIVIFATKKAEKRFTALLYEQGYVEKIIDNFLNGKTSKNDKLGIYVDSNIKCYSDVKNFNHIQNKNKALEKSYNGKLLKLLEIGKINAPDKENKFCECDNAVYIPKLGKTPAVTSVTDFQIKAQNYFQIIVDTEKISPRFLAFFLNTEDGVNIRQLSYRGLTIKALNKQSLGEITVPCPTLDLQLEYLKTYNQLENLRIEIETLKDRLKKIPASYKNIRKNIKDINNTSDKFIQWIENLPYPIATILKQYSVVEESDKKQEMLLYFYEAYAIFNATLLCSALNKNLIDCSKLKGVEPMYFEKASFGNWVRMDRALSNLFIESLNSSNDEEKKAVLECFRTKDETLIRFVCSKNVCNILEQASVHRNNWKGHSGLTNEFSYKEHVTALNDMLNKLQESIKDLYERVRLVRLTSLRKVDGEFINKVEVLTGSNSIFSKDVIKGDFALDESKLYLQLLDTGETLELPPYFILKNSPADAKNACYFYSKVEKGNTKYVSYHFDGKPEDIENNEIAFTHIKQLLTN